jgi:hypothetical protein
MKYKFQSIDKIKTEKVISLAFGSAVHKALEVNYGQKVETQLDLPLEQILEVFSSAYDKETEEVPKSQFTSESKGQFKDSGIRLISEYHRSISPKIIPQFVEIRIEAQVNGADKDYDVNLSGQLDCIDIRNTLIDHKTSSRMKTSVDESYILQQSAYKLLAETHNYKIAGSRIDYLIRKAQPEIKSFAVKTETKFLLGVLKLMIQTIKHETYIPNRSSYLCSRKYCTFWQLCEDKMGGTVKD